MARGYSNSTYDAAARPSSTSGDRLTPSNSALARSASPVRNAARPSRDELVGLHLSIIHHSVG